MLYALAMPSSSSPCGDGARNAKRVLGKKVCAQEGPPNFDLAQFCQQKRKNRKKRRNRLLFCQEAEKNKGRQTLRSRASWSEFGLAQLCHHWHCLLYQYHYHPSILTQSLSSFYKSSYGYSIYPHHYDNISQDFPRQSEITKWIEKGGWPTRMYPLTGLHKL